MDVHYRVEMHERLLKERKCNNKMVANVVYNGTFQQKNHFQVFLAMVNIVHCSLSLPLDLLAN